jgi:hypothetical protein
MLAEKQGVIEEKSQQSSANSSRVQNVTECIQFAFQRLQTLNKTKKRKKKV